MEKIIGVENCEHLETEVSNVSDTYTGDTCCKNCGKVIETGQTVRPKIPEGGTYYVGVTNKDTSAFSYSTYTAKYEAGDEFPEMINDGDIYRYGDYEYRYNQYFTSSSTNFWSTSTSQGGWGVNTINDSKVTYGEILNSINGTPVNTLKYTFGECKTMNLSPKIPESITNMEYAFSECVSLTIPPVIPSNVTNVIATFYSCSSLTTAPILPQGITKIISTFSGCTNLKTYVQSTATDGDFSGYEIPLNVNNMFGTFMNCKLLTVAPIIPNGVTTLENTFNGCSALTNEGVPVIPSSVKYMSNTFSRCTTITDFSNIIIPSIVTSLSQTFSGCTSLVDSGMPIIPNTVTEMYHTFDGCTMLKDLSKFTLPNTVKSLSGTFQNCTALEVAPMIPSSTKTISYLFANCTSLQDVSEIIVLTYNQTMDYTFLNCTSLTGEVKVQLASNHGNTITGCFQGTTQPIKIIPDGYASIERMNALAATGNNGNVTVQE